MRALLFLALLLLVWVLGIVRGERITRSVAALPPFFSVELARFERLRPQLAAAGEAVLLTDRAPGLPFGERFFAAQYSLAPTVLLPAFAVDAVVGRSWKGEPRLVLCAFDDRDRRTAALAALAAAARGRGLTFSAEPVDDVLTLVRLGEV